MSSSSSCRLFHVLPLALLLTLFSLTPTAADPDALTSIIDFSKTSSPPISPNFVGFSLETSSATGWVGADPSTPKASFLTLMRQLLLTPHSPGTILRIGGNSADESLWNPTHLPLPANITYSIQPIDIIAVTNAVKALNGSAVFGVNFRRADNSSWAVAHAEAINQYGDWSRTTLEIGNECDLYGGNGIRSHNWTYAEYDEEWSTYAQSIAAAVPSAPKRLFQGATVAGHNWYPNLTQYATEHKAVLASLSVHAYPTSHCSGRNVTIQQILADGASSSEAAELTLYQLPSNLASLSIPLQLGEGNSASCGGFPNVSNVFASALWAIDDLYNLAGIGLKGMNFHGGGSSLASYSALVWPNPNATKPTVQPLFYGLLMFARGTRNTPKTVPVTVAQTTNSLIKVHATWDGTRMAVMIIHKDSTKPLNESASVVLAFPAPPTFNFPPAKVSRLSAKSVVEKTQIVLAGQTFEGTEDGTMSGTEAVEIIAPQRLQGSGQYELKVAPVTAVLLEWEVTGEEARQLNLPFADQRRVGVEREAVSVLPERGV